MNYILCSIIGYLIGSFPTAFILMKKLTGMDITEHGSGNVGTLNAFEVSNSKLIGIIVLLIDLFKGILSIYFAKLLFPPEFIYSALALLFAVIAHCFSPWVKFKGGRGLATGAGGFLVLSPFILLTWLIVWLISQLIRKNVHLSNFVATVFTIILISTISGFFMKYSLPRVESKIIFICPIVLLLITILIRHYGPLKEYFKNLLNNEVINNEKI